MGAETPRLRVKRVLREHDVSQSCLATMAELNPGVLSKILTGQLTARSHVMGRIEHVCDFIETLAAEAKPLPLCFHTYERIKPLWDAFPHRGKRPYKLRSEAA